ncbi:hypothetical protein FIBSPDRAFT_929532 [Athelia psychrophila]|uniref:Uncharacterized protein n=1 Tax=Athelia psychrophila TaxID=1759441 RepID=A0A166NFZ6_9AGAM|nr:hypothetical protein FIBSPDRAFT_929532 [Fibularhizoctonia sp. CBS 109695]
MAWGVFRGIIAVYTCVGLAIFSAYSGISEVQLYASSNTGFALQDTILPQTLTGVEADDLWVNIVFVSPNAVPVDLNVSSASSSFSSGTWFQFGSNTSDLQNQNWSPIGPLQQLPNFNISWTGQGSPAVWISGGFGFYDSRFPNLTQSNFTEPLLLFPFMESSITLTAISYTTTSGEGVWMSYQPTLQMRFAANFLVPLQWNRVSFHSNTLTPLGRVLFGHGGSGVTRRDSSWVEALFSEPLRTRPRLTWMGTRSSGFSANSDRRGSTTGTKPRLPVRILRLPGAGIKTGFRLLHPTDVAASARTPSSPSNPRIVPCTTDVGLGVSAGALLRVVLRSVHVGKRRRKLARVLVDHQD